MTSLYHALFQDSGWSVAIATWLLICITALAAGFGVPTAIAAAKTFRLESDPVILVRKLTEANRPFVGGSGMLPAAPGLDVTAAYVVDGMPLVVDGIELRPRRPQDANHPNATLAAKKITSLVIHNAGRSPAIAVAIPFSVTTPVHVDLSHVDPEELSDVQDLVGYGEVELPGIGAGESVVVQVTNLLGNAAVLKAAELGTSLRIEGTKRIGRALPIVALEEIILPSP
jgi:hypothetical protein